MSKKKPTAAAEEESRSQVMAVAERIMESGVTKAVILSLHADGSVSMSGTEDTSQYEIIYMLRQGEHLLLTPMPDDDDD